MHQRRTSKGSWWPVVVAVLMTAMQEHVCMRSCDDTILPPPSALHIASTQHTSRRDFCRYVTRTLFMDKWLFVCGIPQKYKLLYILNIKSCGSKLSGNNLQLQDLCWICPFCDKTTFWCGMRPIRCRKKIENWKIYRICPLRHKATFCLWNETLLQMKSESSIL